MASTGKGISGYIVLSPTVGSSVRSPPVIPVKYPSVAGVKSSIPSSSAEGTPYGTGNSLGGTSIPVGSFSAAVGAVASTGLIDSPAVQGGRSRGRGGISNTVRGITDHGVMS